MGLLTIGEPLSWNETKKYAKFVRDHGIIQFINLYNLCKNKTSEVLKFGDEIEYMVLKFDDKSRKVRVSNRAVELLKILQEPEEKGLETNSLWRPEFGAYMVEGTPGLPYTMDPIIKGKFFDTDDDADDDNNGFIKIDDTIAIVDTNTTNNNNTDTTANSIINNNKNDDVKIDQNDSGTPSSAKDSAKHFAFLDIIEANMRLRRKQVKELLEPDEGVLSISSFPMLGTFDFCHPESFVHPTTGHGRSLFFPDQAIFSGHPRFKTLANNVRERRGKNVDIYLPIYNDIKTPNPFKEDFIEALNVDQKKLSKYEYEQYSMVSKQRQDLFFRDDNVYMDAMGFGMGCCCLQVTFQASNIDEAYILYDQLAPLCPIMMSMSAASPIFRGYLVDVDCRWSVISQSVDDRMDSEKLGYDPNTGEKCRKIAKSRFDSIDLFIGPDHQNYNDIDVVYDETYFSQMLENGVPKPLAKHIAHLFIRDPLVLFKEKLDIDDNVESDHFENIQSTNWQTMRFKPPPLSAPEIGWRVEFRPMELQMTDTENAAFVIFIVLLTRLILSFNIDFLIPMSKVEENMKVAQKRESVRNGKFWFRRDISFPKIVCDQAVKAKPGCLITRQISKRVSQANKPVYKNIDSCCIQLTINEIINGTDDNIIYDDDDYDKIAEDNNNKDKIDGSFPGLIPLLNFYLDSIEIDAETRCSLNTYLKLISKRADGRIPTAAELIRKFVMSHDEYQDDSRITDGINYDLLKYINRLQSDEITLDEFVKFINNKQQQRNKRKEID